MEGTTRPRLHPLLTAAAISVTVFSAVGVGALTGFLPNSHSSARESAPTVADAPAQPAALAAEAPAMPAAPAAAPAPRPAKKHVVHAAPKPVEVAAAAPAPEAPPMAASVPPPPPAPVEAAAPVPIGTFGVVESVREASQPGQGSALGPIAGGIAGAILGSQFGHGDGRSLMTIAGAAGGAFAGKEVEKRATSSKKWEITVRLDDGSRRMIPSATAPIWHGGERVRLVDGQVLPI